MREDLRNSMGVLEIDSEQVASVQPRSAQAASFMGLKGAFFRDTQYADEMNLLHKVMNHKLQNIIFFPGERGG